METGNQQLPESTLTPPLDSPQQSDPESPLEMTVVLNESNPYWTNDAPLRCASNAELGSVGGKARRDFKFQVTQVHTGPRWFIFPSNKNENVDTAQSPIFNNSDQENMRENSNSVRRSMRFLNRRKASNDYNKTSIVSPISGFMSYEEEMCNITVTNQDTTMSEPTTRRIDTKPMDCRFQITSSLSPPSTSSECSTFSNQSTMSSYTSDTFQILAVATKCESDDEEEQTDMDQTNPARVCLKDPNKQDTPMILISSADSPSA